MDNNQVLNEIVIGQSNDGFIGQALRIVPMNPQPLVEEQRPLNQRLIDQFDAALTEQLKTRCDMLRALDENHVIVGEEEGKKALEDFIKRRRKKKLPTEGVVAMSFDVHPLHHDIYEEMENLVPKAKAKAESQNRPWVSFHDRLDGWMIERRGRTDKTIIKFDLYFHHKSGVNFKSMIFVNKFVLHNEYPRPLSDKNDSRPRRWSRRVNPSKLQRTYQRKNVVGPSDSLTNISKRKRAYKRKLAPSSLEAPPLATFAPLSTSCAPSSPKRLRIDKEETRIDIDPSRVEMEVAETCLTFMEAPQDGTIMVMNGDADGESRFGKLVDHVLEFAAREEFEADRYRAIDNAMDPTRSVIDKNSENEDGSRVGAEVDDGANLTVFSSGEVADVGPVEEEANNAVPIAKDDNHTSTDTPCIEQDNGKGNDVESVDGVVTVTNSYVAPMYETLEEGMIRQGWIDPRTLEDGNNDDLAWWDSLELDVLIA